MKSELDLTPSRASFWKLLPFDICAACSLVLFKGRMKNLKCVVHIDVLYQNKVRLLEVFCGTFSFSLNGYST